MIPRLAGWSWDVQADGVLLQAYRDDALGSAIRYYEHQRPVAPLPVLVERHRPRGESIVQVGEVEQLVTQEGEYARMVQHEGMYAGEPVRWVQGFVLVDDGYAYVEAACARDRGDALARTVRQLLITDAHQLGIRRRRYRHDAPGWLRTELAGAIAVYARDGSTMLIYPAMPFARAEHVVIDLQRTLGEDLVVRRAGPASGFTVAYSGPATAIDVAGLRGHRYRIEGHWGGEPDVRRDIAVLRDTHYVYAAQLVTTTAELAAAGRDFDAVVRSIEPIPPPRAHIVAPAQSPFSHYAD